MGFGAGWGEGGSLYPPTHVWRGVINGTLIGLLGSLPNIMGEGDNIPLYVHR